MKLFHFFFLIVVTSNGFSQNLIANPSFEEYFNCPSSFNSKRSNQQIAPHWQSASYGTPDLFNTCNLNGQVGSNNLCGFTEPFEGNGFAGLIAWEKSGFREYLIGEINAPLKKDATYKLSYRYKLAQYSKYVVDQMGVYFSTTPPFQKTEQELTGITPYIHKKEKAFTPETGTWELLEYEIKATGDEKYFVIGNFSSNLQCSEFHLKYRKNAQPMLKEAAYFYIDDIQLISRSSLAVTPPKTSQVFTLKRVNFAHDKTALLPESYNELDSIAYLLKKYPELDITIIGHTDNSGSNNHNLRLSKERALAVQEYFIQLGFESKRFRIIGKGSSEPLSGKNSAKNRRVEFLFIENSR